MKIEGKHEVLEENMQWKTNNVKGTLEIQPQTFCMVCFKKANINDNVCLIL